MTPHEFETFLKEIRHWSRLPSEYVPLLRAVGGCIVHHGFRLWCHSSPDAKASETEHRFRRVGLAVNIRGRSGQGARDLWDLIHELGHVLIGSPDDPASVEQFGEQETVQREQAAWDSGWQEAVDGYPAAADWRDSFRHRQEDCLNTYRRRGGLPVRALPPIPPWRW